MKKCVRSVMMQSYHNLEIILVDDGSPDNCPLICDHLAEEDARIKVIHKMNGGLSDARNKGMEICKGDYLFFADSDDYVRRDAFELLLEVATSKDIDLVCGDYCLVNEDGECIDHGLRYPNCELTLEEAIEYFITKDWGAWGKLYHRSVHSGIKFPVGEINEDEAIVLSLLDRCSVVVQTNEIVYNYRCRAESITTSAFSEKKLAWYRHCQDNLRWIQQYHPELAAFADKRLCSSILWTLREIALSPQNFDEIAGSLQQDIRLNYHKFFKCALSRSERRRLLVLRFLPFQIYQRIEQRMS